MAANTIVFAILLLSLTIFYTAEIDAAPTPSHAVSQSHSHSHKSHSHSHSHS